LKRSRIICSIVTVIYVLISVTLILLLLKSNMLVKSSVPTYIKAIYGAIFGVCTLMYIVVKRRLSKKMSNKSLGITLSRGYCYLYLAVIIFVTRFIMAYILKGNVVEYISPGFNVGLGSYINYGLGLVIKNQMYANVIVNVIITFIACIVIKKILLNITENDMIATVASIMYIFIPQSFMYVTEYVRYSYNVLSVLVGIFVIVKIIDEVKKFNKNSNKYLIYSVILGIIASIDIILGGSYILWFSILIFITLAAMYVDTVHMHIGFKQKLNYKFKILAERVEKTNISKLVCVSVITLLVSGITVLIYFIIFNTNNYQMFNVNNCISILRHSRTYYLVLVIFAVVFEIIGVILKRKLDIKMFAIKMALITTAILTFFMVDGIHASAVFDVLLVLTVIINVCNICYNREERVKLLKDKN